MVWWAQRVVRRVEVGLVSGSKGDEIAVGW